MSTASKRNESYVYIHVYRNVHYVQRLVYNYVHVYQHARLLCTTCTCTCTCITTGSSKASTSPFLLSLTGSLLSLSSPTRGKYQLLSTLSHHLPVTTLLLTSPTLLSELLSVMGRQALACHVGPPSLVCNYFVVYHQCLMFSEAHRAVLCCAVL